MFHSAMSNRVKKIRRLPAQFIDSTLSLPTGPHNAVLKMKGLKSYKEKEKKNNPGLSILFITVVFFTLGVVQFEGYSIEQLWMSE